MNTNENIESGKDSAQEREKLDRQIDELSPQVKDMSKLHYVQALTYEGEGNDLKAKEELETAIALDSENSNVLHEYATVLQRLGEHDKAVEFFTKTIAKLEEVYPDGHQDIDTAKTNLELATEAKESKQV